MMPNITRGGRTTGLVAYLLGPGRTNEHTTPHVVGGSTEIVDLFGGMVLGKDDASGLAKLLDQYRLDYDTEITGSIWDYDQETNERISKGKGKAHVWHCSLSLSPEEGPLDEETWTRIASDFMDEMGFTDASGKAPCKWVAIHHGSSKNGGDHIHIAAVLVRADGTKHPVWHDFKKSQQACNMLEKKYGLEVLESRDVNRGSIGETPSEQRAAQAEGVANTDRSELEIRIRAAAVSAVNEAEFIQLLRQNNVAVRPRYAKGGTEQVDGYYVALYESGKPKQWFGGGRIARDLTLPRLRQNWQVLPYPTGEIWRSSTRQHIGIPTGELTSFVSKALAEIDAINPQDQDALSLAAAQVAGVYAAMSNVFEPRGGKLSKAAKTIGQSAQRYRKPRTYRRYVPYGLPRMVVTKKLNPRRFQRDLIRLGNALARAHYRAGQVNTAARIDRQLGYVDQMKFEGETKPNPHNFQFTGSIADQLRQGTSASPTRSILGIPPGADMGRKNRL